MRRQWEIGHLFGQHARHLDTTGDEVIALRGAQNVGNSTLAIEADVGLAAARQPTDVGASGE